MKLKYRLRHFQNSFRGGKRRGAPKSIDRVVPLKFVELLEIDPLADERYFVSIVRDPSALCVETT